MIPNVLATRYASPALRDLWSPEAKVVLERELWLAVLEAQRELGVDVPAGAVDAYRAVLRQVDLASIAARERVTRHDVKARIEEFCALAGHEQVHKGMTSRDLTENVEQLQVRRSLELVRDKCVAALVRLAALAAEHAPVVMAGRSHNVAAQATTLGKRFATAGEELLQATRRLQELIDRYPLRGIRGPVGTQQDMLDLLGGPDAVDALERRVQTLEDERAITRLIASYGPLVDVGDAEGVAGLWAAEGTYDVGDWVMSNRAEVAAMVESEPHQGLINRGCCHFFGPPVVTVTGDSAVAVCESVLVVAGDRHRYQIVRAGVHLLRLRRHATGWQITQRTARQLDGSGRAGDLVAAGLGRSVR